MRQIYTGFPTELDYKHFLNKLQDAPDYNTMQSYNSFFLQGKKWVAVLVDNGKFCWYGSLFHYENAGGWIPIFSYTLYPNNNMNPENIMDEVVATENVATEPMIEEATPWLEVYKTTEGNYLVKKPEGNVAYDKDWNIFNGTQEAFGSPSSKVRRDSAIYKKISWTETVRVEKKSKLTPIDNIKWFDVMFNKEDFSLSIDVKWELIPINKEWVEKIRSQFNSYEKIKTELVASASGYRTWDRVLLYWPTGTGKTYDFLSSVLHMQKMGKIDTFDITTITEWFEDIDFLAHIVPTDKWITYVENKIVTLLREAANGKKVAILLDELNRGSKSFLNLILKLLDAVDGKTYTLNNFVKNETIIIPIENVLFFATMNLGWKYVGTNALDEALFDRFNIVQYKWYNAKIEDEIADAFWMYKKQALDIVKYVRELHKEWEIRAPISTRWVKMWWEAFLSSAKSKDDILWSFSLTLINRLISVDDFGNPNQEEIAIIMKKFKDLSLIS